MNMIAAVGVFVAGTIMEEHVLTFLGDLGTTSKLHRLKVHSVYRLDNVWLGA